MFLNVTTDLRVKLVWFAKILPANHKTGSNFPHLSVTITISPKWFDNSVFLPVSLWESPNLSVGYKYDYSQVIWQPVFYLLLREKAPTALAVGA